jgi:hypothetical protein
MSSATVRRSTPAITSLLAKVCLRQVPREILDFGFLDGGLEPIPRIEPSLLTELGA